MSDRSFVYRTDLTSIPEAPLPLPTIPRQADKIATSQSFCATGAVCARPWQSACLRFILGPLCSEIPLLLDGDLFSAVHPVGEPSKSFHLEILLKEKKMLIHDDDPVGAVGFPLLPAGVEWLWLLPL